MGIKRVAAASTVALSAFLPALASAADMAEEPLAVPAVSSERWGLTVGGFAGFAPKYEGSNEYRFVGYPLIIPKYYSQNYDPLAAPRVSVKGIDDVRIAVLRFGAIDIGPVVGYNFGRDEDDDDRLGGLGDVDGGLNVGGFVSIRFERFFVDAAFLTQVTGDTDVGHTIWLGAGWEDRISERLTARAYLSSAYASDDYMDGYFSVSPAQSASSTAGLPVFDAEAGFKNVSFEIGADYSLTERWTVTSKLGYSRLLGDAADSPITSSANQFFGGVGLTYTFGRVR